MSYNKYSGKLTGTSGATFTVVRTTATGVIGYREIAPGSFRVRVEPFVDYVSLPCWNQPESGQNRFSTVVEGSSALAAAIVVAAKALKAAEVPPVSVQIAKALSAAGF